MDYLQYNDIALTFKQDGTVQVLNLIINGLPSILNDIWEGKKNDINSFKPYYKWITFNTSKISLSILSAASRF